MKASGAIKILALLLLILPELLFAQSPKLVSYQAIVRDASKQPMVNTDVTIILTVNQGTPAGTQVYSETHNTTTNDFGLVSIMLGNGTSGDDFSAIDWYGSPYYLNINIEGNPMDPVQLVSVPYAIYADEAGNVFSGDYNDLVNKPELSISNWNEAYSWGDHSTEGYLDSKWVLSGDNIYNLDNKKVNIGSSKPYTGMLSVTADPSAIATDTIFQIINQDGFPVFSILNNGTVKINIDESETKGPKGGFAIGGFDRSKGMLQPYLSINPDSTRLYFNETTAKGPKGGFAIGGFDRSKGINDKYVEVRGARGSAGNNVFLGYLAGGDLGYASTNNVAVGYNAGLNLRFGSENNVFIGYEAGLNASVFENVFIGTSAGRNCTNGYNNVYIGHEAGSMGHGQYNVFIGDEAGKANDEGFANVFIGQSAGANVTTGSQNTFVGTQAGWSFTDGSSGNEGENTFIGTLAGSSVQNGIKNTYIGYSAGSNNTSGSNNVFIGDGTGMLTAGSNNIFIGNGAGLPVTESSYKLIIDCFANTADNAFISGVMSGVPKTLRLNANTGIKTAADPSYDLTVDGNIQANEVSQTSDSRLKTNIQTINDPLKKVLSLRGVTFNWNKEGIPEGKSSMGLIAQEALEVIPELVSKGSEYYSINYAPLTALLIEAIKELKKENDELKGEVTKIDELEKQIRELKMTIEK